MNITIIIVFILLGILAIYLLHCMVFHVMVITSKDRKNNIWLMKYASNHEYYKFILGAILNILFILIGILFLILKIIGKI